MLYDKKILKMGHLCVLEFVNGESNDNRRIRTECWRIWQQPAVRVVVLFSDDLEGLYITIYFKLMSTITNLVQYTWFHNNLFINVKCSTASTGNMRH